MDTQMDTNIFYQQILLHEGDRLELKYKFSKICLSTSFHY